MAILQGQGLPRCKQRDRVATRFVPPILLNFLFHFEEIYRSFLIFEEFCDSVFIKL